jgi:molybdopterin synthase catalytic subunit
MQHTAAGDAAVLTHAPLDGGALLADVREPAAGATVLFVGTTRNEFDGACGARGRLLGAALTLASYHRQAG